MSIPNNMVENGKLLDEKYFQENLDQVKTTFDKNVLTSKSISLAFTEILSLIKTVFLGTKTKL